MIRVHSNHENVGLCHDKESNFSLLWTLSSWFLRACQTPEEIWRQAPARSVTSKMQVLSHLPSNPLPRTLQLDSQPIRHFTRNPVSDVVAAHPYECLVCKNRWLTCKIMQQQTNVSLVLQGEKLRFAHACTVSHLSSDDGKWLVMHFRWCSLYIYAQRPCTVLQDSAAQNLR